MARIYLSPPDVGADERELLLDAFDSNWLGPVGSHAQAFEREIEQRLDVPHATLLSSGTAGLHLALLLLGVGPGDRVLCSTLTFSATANPVRYVGAEPVFVDSEPQSWNIDPDLLAQELEDADRKGRLPAAVIAVDLYGQTADYGRIVPLCARYGIPLIEDAAEALGADYQGRAAGSFGTFGVLSFNANKIITASGGGMLLSHDERHAGRAQKLANQSREPAAHYQHEEIGYNYRMSNLLAGLGRGQLANLDSKVAARRRTHQAYRESLGGIPGVTFQPDAGYGLATFWLSCLLIDPRRTHASTETIRLALDDADIEARPLWKPMHMQPIFRDCRSVGGQVAENLFQRGLCLPSGSNLSQADRQRVVEVVAAALDA